MAFVAPKTPQRPLPGAFLQTPAPTRYQSATAAQRSQSAAIQNNSTRAQNYNGQQQQQVSTQAQSQPLLPVQHAAKTVNKVLQRDASFPDLDGYIKQGISSDYAIPSRESDKAWAPYQNSKMYDIPDVIFEQYNRAQVSTMMGLFADLNHAWITIDNAIYIWDYTRPNPELIGHEDQPNSITAVKLMVPRPGVFQPKITHVLVVATTMEILLIGVGPSEEPTGNRTLSLYETKMSLPIKGIYVSIIEGSTVSGRIFFAGNGDNEVYELTYQQEEKWFASRCGKINQTSPGYTSLVPTGIWTKRRPEHVVDIAIDDTRNLVYTLSSRSSIRTFHMDTPTTLKLVIEKQRQELLRDISHMMSPSPLLGNSMAVVSISPISALEASKLHLMATTSTGCRLFLSATRGYGYMAGQGDAPQSMQVQHVKFPPRAPQASKQRSPQQISESEATDQPIDTQSTSLQLSRRGIRYPPGYFLCFVAKDTHPGQDILFLSAPDTGRIAYHARESSVLGSKYYEQTLWHGLGSRAEDVGLITKPFSAAPTPIGFGNELAVQFDEPVVEIAILTNTGVHTIRRRRLVDMFASVIRQGGGDEGLEGEINRFVRYYGRGELAAAALAVACGQSTEASSNDTRVAKITDPATIEIARRVFVEFGGRPSLNGNAVPDGTMQAIDQVQPSSRHEGLALYIGRLIRSVWKASVILVQVSTNGGVSIVSKVAMSRLRLVQEELAILDKFLEKNSTFIEGLAGPESLGRVASRQDEIALQGEHQALHSLRVLTRSIVEGISFIMTLFDERVDELWKSLDDATKQRLRNLTYESLFTSTDGKELGKVLVKAIVNLKLASGSNVDTVADSLRRKCASFCSAADVTVFKAQEQVKKASEMGANTDMGRNLLNSSLGLFQAVADSLSVENLQNIVEQYVPLQFYAGAIRLALSVALELDRGNRALAWVNDGKPEGDSRSSFYEKRKRCYELVHYILQAVDTIADQQPEAFDGRVTNMARKQSEAYMMVNDSDDEVFHYDLYDWYLSQGWVDRLLAIRSPFVVKYLQRLSSSNVDYIDLLWRFYAGTERYYEAAAVQVQLAKSDFQLTLKLRVEYLSRAKANASTQTAGIGRQARQVLLHEVTELLEVANIQDEILQRLKGDPRIAQERKLKIVKELDGPIMGLSELYNGYADKAGYFDISLLIYHAADHRNPGDIEATWSNLLEVTHRNIVEQGDEAQVKPFEAIVTVVREVAQKVNLSDTVFPPAVVIPMLEKYAFEHQRDIAPATWVIDLFIDIGIAFENLLSILEQMLYNDEAPFQNRNRRFIAKDMLYVIGKWYRHSVGSSQRVFDSDEIAEVIIRTLQILCQNGLNQEEAAEAQDLIVRIQRTLRIV